MLCPADRTPGRQASADARSSLQGQSAFAQCWRRADRRETPRFPHSRSPSAVPGAAASERQTASAQPRRRRAASMPRWAPRRSRRHPPSRRASPGRDAVRAPPGLYRPARGTMPSRPVPPSHVPLLLARPSRRRFRGAAPGTHLEVEPTAARWQRRTKLCERNSWKRLRQRKIACSLHSEGRGVYLSP